MNVTIVDYKSGNISSVINSFKEVAKNKVKIEIWERGAGYTLASGSSSCGVVSVGYKLGLLNEKVQVIMPGGKLYIEIDKDYKLTMKGPVEEICNGQLKL